MATLAVIQTPFSLLGTLFTGRMVAQYSPVNVYLTGFICRFILSLTGPPLVSFLSSHGTVSTAYYVLVLALTILYSLAAECLMFVGIGAFFLNITSASVHVAGSYLTLLNTSSNMGGIWHKALVLWLVDKVTIRERCVIPLDAAAGTLCPIRYDGYYILSAALLPVALAAGFHLFRALPRLSRLPMSSWQVSRPL